LFTALTRTLGESFGGKVHAFASLPDRPDRVQNIILLAGVELDLPRALREAEPIRPSVALLLRTRLDSRQHDLSSAPVLTDHRNAAELIAARRRGAAN